MKKRPSQGTHKSRPRKGATVGGRRRLKWQKNGEAGFKENWRRLRSARRHRTSLLIEAWHQKVGHAPSSASAWEARGSIFGSGVLRKVADLLLHSWWCGWCRKISPKKYWRWWGFSDHNMANWKALGDGKGNRNETRSLDGFPELITRVN